MIISPGTARHRLRSELIKQSHSWAVSSSQITLSKSTRSVAPANLGTFTSGTLLNSATPQSVSAYSLFVNNQLYQEHSVSGDFRLSLAIFVGTLGSGPTPITGQTNPRISKGKGLSTGWPPNAGPTLRLDVTRGISLDISRPMSARLIFRPGAWGFHSLGGLLNSNVYFLERQFSRAKLPAGFLSYKRKFAHELTSSPPTK